MSSVPRTPILREKSGSYDSTDNYERKLDEWRQAAKGKARDDLGAWTEYGHISRYIDALEGRWYGANYPVYRARFFDNELGKARKDARTVYTDIRPAMAVKPRGGATYSQQGDIIRDCILSEWSSRKMDLDLLEVIDHALFGCGFWKIGATAGNEEIPAHLKVTPCGADAVLPMECPGKLQDAVGVLYNAWKPVIHYRKIWGNLAEGIEKYASIRSMGPYDSSTYSKPGRFTEYTWNSMSPAMKRHLRNRRPPQTSPELTPFPLVELEEYWIDDPSVNESGQRVLVKDPRFDQNQHNYWYYVEPGGLLMPRKRLIVFAGEKKLYDGPSPYWHGLYPFEMLLLDPIVWASRGLSKYRNLMPLNHAINRIGSGVLDTIEKAINQTVVSKKGIITDEEWNRFFPDIPGQKLRMMMTGNPATDIKFMDPPNLPAYVMQYLQQYLLQQFEKHSGALDVQALSKKKQLPAGDSIEMLRDAQAGHFRLEGRLIESFLALSCEQAVSNVLQYFTRHTRMPLLGADGATWQDFDYDPSTMIPAGVRRESFWKRFSVEIVPGSLHGGSRDRKKQEAIVLYKSRAISTRDLLEALEWADIDKVISRRDEEMAKLAQAQQQMGGGGRVPRMTTAQRKGAAV